jgi:hypothetical protein
MRRGEVSNCFVIRSHSAQLSPWPPIGANAELVLVNTLDPVLKAPASDPAFAAAARTILPPQPAVHGHMARAFTLGHPAFSVARTSARR